MTAKKSIHIFGMHQPVSEKPVSDVIIKKRVLERLGRPKNLKSIKAKNVFGTKWRINIYIEEIFIGDRIRDILYLDNEKIILLSLEMSGSIGIIKK